MKLLTWDYIKSYNRIFEETLRASPAGFYDESALPSYTHQNGLMSWLFWKRLDVVFSIVGDVKGKSVLDFGCGGGVTFKYLHEHGAAVTGCDSHSAELAGEISKRFDIGAVIYKDVFDIGGKFDVILALDVFEHIDELDPIINKFVELSRDNTKLIISGPTENLFYRTGRRLAGFSGHYHKTNIYDVERKLTEKGLKREALKRLYPPVTLFRVSRWRFY